MANEINIELSTGKKRLVIAACIMMYFNYMVINMGCGVALEQSLGRIYLFFGVCLVLVFLMGLTVKPKASGS